MTTLPPFPPAQGGTWEYAMAYLSAGWSLLPIKPLDKRPLVRWEPYQGIRAGADEIRDWLNQWPTMNLGVVTGSISGLAVVDVDGQAGLEALSARVPQVAKTLAQKTPHGWHALYRLGARPVKTASGVLPHVDTRGEGGYIVVCPSRLPDGEYRWIKRLPLAPAPGWLETPELLTRPAQPERLPSNGNGGDHWVRDALLNGVPEGQRNATAARLAGYLHSKHIPDDAIEALLLPFASRCLPAMSERELQEIVRSMARYPVGSSNNFLPLDEDEGQTNRAT